MKEILSTLKISTVKVFFYSIFSKSSLIDYLYERANNAINALMDAKPECVSSIRSALSLVMEYVEKYRAYIPTPWLKYTDALDTCLKAVLSATDDGKIVTEEAKAVIEAAMVCYSQFAAD